MNAQVSLVCMVGLAIMRLMVTLVSVSQAMKGFNVRMVKNISVLTLKQKFFKLHFGVDHSSRKFCIHQWNARARFSGNRTQIISH